MTGQSPGAYLGGVRDIEGIRQRCVCDEGGCWSFRLANGRRAERGKRQVVWLYGIGSVGLVKAVWELRAGKSLPEGWKAFRTCDSYDCANPAHIKAGPPAAFGAMMRKRGVCKGNAVHARRAGLLRSKLTPEQRAWLATSTVSHSEAARELGVSVSLVERIRKKHRRLLLISAPSIFMLAAER